MSARDEIAAAFELLRGTAPRIDDAAAPGVAAMRPARVRVSVEAVTGELLVAVIDAFPATARVLGAGRGGTVGWLEDYLRSPELADRPASTRFATLPQLLATFPAFVRRAAGGLPAALGPLLDDALACETAINELRQPDPALAAVMHRLSGPFASLSDLLSAADVTRVGAVAIAGHVRIGIYGRDVAALIASARSRLAGFLSPSEWVAALATQPLLAARPGPYRCAHVLRPSGDVTTIQIAEATAAALLAGVADVSATPRDDLLRLAAAGALRAARSARP